MHLVIIGNGMAGVACALEVRRRSSCTITVISEESPYFFSRPALMYLYMKQISQSDALPYGKDIWKKNNIELVHDRVESIDFEKKQVKLTTHTPVNFDKLLLATGSKAAKLNCPGEDLSGIHSFYALQDLDQLEKDSIHVTRAAVVGGGLIGVELAEMFRSRGMQVDWLIREKRLMEFVLPEEESLALSAHVAQKGVQMYTNEVVSKFEANSSGTLREIRTTSGRKLEVQLAGIAVGVQPNVAFLNGSGLELNRGILVDTHFQTNIPDVFAAGDCAELRQVPKGYRAIEATWYSARMQGICAALNICGKATPYSPPVWYNSAKFFEMEYQVYGNCPAESMDESSISSCLWTNRQKNRLLRIYFDSSSEAVVGISGLGIRLRQTVISDWIQHRRTYSDVIRHMQQAFFDPEFSDLMYYPAYERHPESHA
jgi:NAD(P)H-nitrite reductase large subunit